MTTPIRGLHLYGSAWYQGDNPMYNEKFEEDHCWIDQIGNLNSVKTSLYSYKDSDPTIWQPKQKQKISDLYYHPSLGSKATYIFRCWPVQADFIRDGSGNILWYQSGEAFAQSLVKPFYRIRSLGITYAYMEVGNEPNSATEPFMQSMTAYNDFLRGFYWGERSINYDFGLVYAGLAVRNYYINQWYQDGSVQQHIKDYCAKVGIHIYWQPDHREDEFEFDGPAGRYYRWVKRTLEAAGVGPKGLMITEFGTPRRAWSNDGVAQINDECAWWQGTYQDALNGYWTEQAFLYVSNADGDEDILDYELLNSQTQAIQLC